MVRYTQEQTLLHPKHFYELRTRFGKKGLLFNQKIGRDERELETSDLRRHDWEIFMNRVALMRPFTRIILNPRSPTASSLLAHFEKVAKDNHLDDSVQIGFGLPKAYDLTWQRKKHNDAEAEGQHLVLVAFDSSNKDPVGYLGFRSWITHNPDDQDRLPLIFELELVYVLAEYRKQGYGIDLSVAGGYICRDILTATYRAVPSGATIVPIVTAEYESFGGEDCAEQIKDSLDYCVDLLDETGKRSSVYLDSPTLDADF